MFPRFTWWFSSPTLRDKVRVQVPALLHYTLLCGIVHVDQANKNSETRFFLRKWFGASAAKKVDEPLDSRQGQEPTARVGEDAELTTG